MSSSLGCNTCGRVINIGHDCYTPVKTSWISIYDSPKVSGEYKVLLNNGTKTTSIFNVESDDWCKPTFKKSGYGKNNIVNWWNYAHAT